MTITVGVDEETKAHLKELQAVIRLRTGTEVTQQEILERLVEDAYESKSTIVDSFRSTTVPLTEKQKEAMAEGRFSSGIEADDSDCDDVLYG